MCSSGKVSFTVLGCSAGIHLRSKKSDLLVAAFRDIQAIIILLAPSGLRGYFMESLATANHLLSIHIACCCFKVVSSM